MSDFFNGPEPIWHQLADYLEQTLIRGTIGEGEAYPSVRTLAAKFSINPQTVLKGFQELQRRGLAETRRGEGTFAPKGIRDRVAQRYRYELLHSILPDLVRRARDCGVTAAELIDCVDRQYAKPHRAARNPNPPADQDMDRNFSKKDQQDAE